MDLATFWFILIGVLWTGYFVLEGFDFGVGMLLPRARPGDETERRVAAQHASARSGTATRCGCSPPAARPSRPSRTGTPRCSAVSTCRCCSSSSPSSCATSASSTATSAATRSGGALGPAIFWGSLVPALLWGVALTNIVRGVPIDANKEYTGNLFTLLNPAGLLGGLSSCALFLTHGAIFVALKTDGRSARGAPDRRARRGRRRGARGRSCVWTRAHRRQARLVGDHRGRGRSPSSAGSPRTGPAARAGPSSARPSPSPWRSRRSSSCSSRTSCRARRPRRWNLTIDNASSTDYTLKVMTIVALVFTPIVLIYQGWTYWVFRVGSARRELLAARY